MAVRRNDGKGWDAARCGCRKDADEKERQERLIRFCALPAHTAHMTFENFDYGRNPSLKEAYDAALQLADDKEMAQWLTLLGTSDQGKTHLAVAICRRWLARGKAARYTFVPLLLKELRDGFELEGEESYRQRFDRLCRVPLLVLDDLAVERPTPFAQEQLQTIVHYRGINGLPLVVTCNKSLEELEIDPERRIASRLQREDWCRVVVIDAPEYRLRREKWPNQKT